MYNKTNSKKIDKNREKRERKEKGVKHSKHLYLKAFRSVKHTHIFVTLYIIMSHVKYRNKREGNPLCKSPWGILTFHRDFLNF